MLTIAVKNLWSDKTRLAVSVFGVALSVTLMMVLWSLYSGWDRQIVAYVKSIDAGIWVTPMGVTDLTSALPELPESIADQVRALPGVAKVTPIFSRQYVVGFGSGETANALIVGYDPSLGGGPVRTVKGASSPQAGEIIVDRGFSRDHGIGVGDRVMVGNTPFTVAGISEGGNIFAYQIAFLQLQEAQAALATPGKLSLLAVSLTQGASPSDVIGAIDSTTGVTAETRDAFVQASRSFMDRGFLPLISVLITIGFAVGVAVIGLTIYTSIIDKAREYGVLKAIGASNAQLYLLAVDQAVIVSTLGYGAGLLISFGARKLGAMAVTTFITSVNLVDYGWVFGAALLMSMLASYLPVRRLLTIDPVEVFKQ